MPHEEVFQNAQFKSHMPFFDGTDMMFCRSDAATDVEFQSGGTIWARMARDPQMAERFKDLSRSRTISYQPWKLFHCSWSDRRQRQQIATGLAAGTVECSPAFYRDADGLHVSFIGGVPTQQCFVYKLYTMSGAAWDSLSAAEPFDDRETRAGFVSSRYVCVGVADRLELTRRDTNELFSLECPLSRILRVTYRADDLDSLLITGVAADENEQTLLYKINTAETFDVRTPDGVYKSSIHGDRIVFAHRGDSGLEDRRLQHGNYTLQAVASGVTRVATHHFHYFCQLVNVTAIHQFHIY